MRSAPLHNTEDRRRCWVPLSANLGFAVSLLAAACSGNARPATTSSNGVNSRSTSDKAVARIEIGKEVRTDTDLTIRVATFTKEVVDPPVLLGHPNSDEYLSSAEVEYCNSSGSRQVVGRNDWILELSDGRQVDANIVGGYSDYLGNSIDLLDKFCQGGRVHFVVPRDAAPRLIVYMNRSTMQRSTFRSTWVVGPTTTGAGDVSKGSESGEITPRTDIGMVARTDTSLAVKVASFTKEVADPPILAGHPDKNEFLSSAEVEYCNSSGMRQVVGNADWMLHLVDRTEIDANAVGSDSGYLGSSVDLREQQCYQSRVDFVVPRGGVPRSIVYMNRSTLRRSDFRSTWIVGP